MIRSPAHERFGTLRFGLGFVRLFLSKRCSRQSHLQRAIRLSWHCRTRLLLSVASPDRRQAGRRFWIFAVVSVALLWSSELAAEPACAPVVQVHRLACGAASAPGIAWQARPATRLGLMSDVW